MKIVSKHIETPVTTYLSKKQIPFRLFQHPGPITNLEQAARERQQLPEQIIRSIVFRLKQGEYFMVLVSGKSQISWTAVRKHFTQSRLTLASEEEMESVTGYKIGAVSPFGITHPMRILVDQKISSLKEISIGSGKRGVAVIMNTKDMFKALTSYEIGDFT